jgi:hypothetical protein
MLAPGRRRPRAQLVVIIICLNFVATLGGQRRWVTFIVVIFKKNLHLLPLGRRPPQVVLMVIVISLNLVVVLGGRRQWIVFIIVVFFFNTHLLPPRRWRQRAQLVVVIISLNFVVVLGRQQQWVVFIVVIFFFQCSSIASKEMIITNTACGCHHFLKIMVCCTKETTTMSVVHRHHLFFMLIATSTKETMMMNAHLLSSPFLYSYMLPPLGKWRQWVCTLIVFISFFLKCHLGMATISDDDECNNVHHRLFCFSNATSKDDHHKRQQWVQ